jgi:hypothetical protein
VRFTPFEIIEDVSENFRALAIPMMEFRETFVRARAPTGGRISPQVARFFGADMAAAVRPFEKKKVYHKITNLMRIANLVRTNFTPGSEQSENFLLPPVVSREMKRTERRRSFVDGRDTSPPVVSDALVLDDTYTRDTSPPVVSDALVLDDTYTLDRQNGLITFHAIRGICVLEPPETTDKPVSGPWPERTPHGPARQREKKQRHAKMYGMGLDKQSRF